MIARLPGVRSAPPTPCSTLAAMRNSAVGASAHSREAPVKAITPITNTRRRPTRSPSEPPSRISDASASVYAFTIHWSALVPVLRSRPMCGSATFTTVPSRNVIPEPMTATARTQRPRALSKLSCGPGS
jgi:hypothetical protein